MQHSKSWDATKPCYGKFWVDTTDGRIRQTVKLGVCRTKTIARQLLQDYIEREGINDKQKFVANTAPATTFREQAERWISSLPNRRRKPVKPATIANWRHALDKWVLPHLGEKPLAEVSNAALREFVGKMLDAGLAAKSVVTHVQVVKLVLASAVDDEGDQVHPRKWNHDFIGLPIINPNKQRRPTVAAEELEHVLPNVKERYAVLFALLAGTGLRVGEALALKSIDLSPDCYTLHVRRSIWRGKEQEPKTQNAIRVVDIPDLLARLLQGYVATRSGYLFATGQGRPLQQRNVLRVFHAAMARKVGFHALRRFRTEVLRKARVPEDLVRLWLGHSDTSITDRYAHGLREDVAWRKEWAERIGLGFELVHMVHKTDVQVERANAA